MVGKLPSECCPSTLFSNTYAGYTALSNTNGQSLTYALSSISYTGA